MFSEIDDVLEHLRQARVGLAYFAEELGADNPTVYANLRDVLGKLRELGASIPGIVEELDKE